MSMYTRDQCKRVLLDDLKAAFPVSILSDFIGTSNHTSRRPALRPLHRPRSACLVYLDEDTALPEQIALKLVVEMEVDGALLARSQKLARLTQSS
jgi:hypothetical protein